MTIIMIEDQMAAWLISSQPENEQAILDMSDCDLIAQIDLHYVGGIDQFITDVFMEDMANGWGWVEV